ncbi:MAG: PKD domain-containing protein, partial [Chitinophagaceae bacterium]
MKTITISTLNSFLKRIFLAVTLLFISFSASSYSSSCQPGSVQNNNNDPWSGQCLLNNNCQLTQNIGQANDVNFLGVYIADQNGNPLPIFNIGDTVDVYVWGTFFNNSNSDRYAARVSTEIFLDGNLVSEENECVSDIVPPGTSNLLMLGPISFSYGQQFELLNTWVSVQTGGQCSNPSGSNYRFRCSDYGANRTDFIGGPISFLVTNFNYFCGDFTENTTEVCFNDITVGGTPPYTYSWNFGDGTIITNNSSPCHTYQSTTDIYTATLTVTDSEGITSSVTLEVDLGDLFCPDPSVSVSKSATPENYSLEGQIITYLIEVQNDGNISLFDIVVNDPMLGLDTTLSNLSPGDIVLLSGEYVINSSDLTQDSIVNVVDVNATAANTSNVLDSDSAIIYFCSVDLDWNLTEPSCKGDSNGVIELIINDAVEPVSILWDDNSTSKIRTDLSKGTYSVTVTDANGCIKQTDIILTEPAENLEVEVFGSGGCFNSSEGIAEALVNGGIEPYQYAWSTGDTSQMIYNIDVGNYSITVTDANGCEKVVSFEIEGNDVNISAGDDVTICAGDTVQLNAIGAMMYEWFPADGLSNNSVSNPLASPQQTTTYMVVGAVPSGELVVNGDFESGNTGFYSEYDYINDPFSGSWSTGLGPESTYTVTHDPSIYHPNFVGNDHTTGSGNFMAINGAEDVGVKVWCQDVVIEPFTEYYFSAWITSIHPQSPAILAFSINDSLLGPPIQAPNVASNPSVWEQFYAIYYSDTATVAQICIVNQNQAKIGNDFGLDDISFTTVCKDTTYVTVFVDEYPEISVTGDTAICVGSTVEISVFGDTDSILWNTGQTSESINVAPNETTTYTVTSYIANGCNTIEEVTITINEEPNLVINVIGQPVCETDLSGEVELTLTSGLSPFSVIITGTDTTISGTINELDLAQSFSGLSEGIYNVSIVDANGCETSGNFEIELIEGVDLSLAVNSNFNGFGVSCINQLDGVIVSSVSGGTPPYSYLWSNNQTSQNLNNIGAGIYTLTVTDANQCEAIESVELTAPSELAATSTEDAPILCNGETTTVTVSATGGIEPYTGTGTFTVSAGTHDFTVTDANGCISTTTITISEPSELVLSTITSPVFECGYNISCSNGNDGSININISGGASPITYTWIGPNGYNSTDQNLNNITAG